MRLLIILFLISLNARATDYFINQNSGNFKQDNFSINISKADIANNIEITWWDTETGEKTLVSLLPHETIKEYITPVNQWRFKLLIHNENK